MLKNIKNKNLDWKRVSFKLEIISKDSNSNEAYSKIWMLYPKNQTLSQPLSKASLKKKKLPINY